MTAPREEDRRDRGAVIVEFALIVPILLLLLVGIIEFGRAYNLQIAVQGAAREGARAAALGDDANDAVSQSAGGLPITVQSVSGCPATNASATQASVTTSAPITFGLPFLDLGTRTLTATASMRCGL